MPVRIRLELSDSEEIVIRCREETDRTERLMRAIEELLTRKDTVVLSLGGAEHFVPKNEILYFESSGGTVYAHTKDSIFTTNYKLYELESIMDPCFTRVSKSVVANLVQVSSIQREVVGNGILTFYGSDKKVWFSRAYSKLLRHKLDEIKR